MVYIVTTLQLCPTKLSCCASMEAHNTLMLINTCFFNLLYDGIKHQFRSYMTKGK